MAWLRWAGIYLCPVIRERCLGGCQPRPAEPCPDTTPPSPSTYRLQPACTMTALRRPVHCYLLSLAHHGASVTASIQQCGRALLALVSFLPITHSSIWTTCFRSEQVREIMKLQTTLLSHISPVYRKSEWWASALSHTSLNWNKKGFTQLFLSTLTPHRRQVISVSFMKSYTGRLQVCHNKSPGDLTEAWSGA